MMARFTLYGRGESGNTYKVALMLNLCRLDWTPKFVDFFNPVSKAAFVDDLNNMEEIPVLAFGGRRLVQSGAILTFLADLTGDFGGRNNEERLDVLRWMLFDNHRFSSFYATLRMQVGLRKSGETEVTAFLRAQAEAAFATVERHLATRRYMVGERPTIADISMVGYAYFTEETGLNRSRYPNMLLWAKRVSELPGWAHPYDLMPRAMPPTSP